MANLQGFYQNMWFDAIHHYENNDCELDLNIQDLNDTRRGLTVLSYLDKLIVEKILIFLNELKQIEPQQHYYCQQDMHITILSIISCITGFKLKHIDVDAYIKVFLNTVSDMEPIDIQLKGVTVSPSCILIQGFTCSDQLSDLRQRLRENYRKAGLMTSMDTRYIIETAHLTVVRCVVPFKQSEQVLAILTRYQDFVFGSFSINSVEFVFNNWYQSTSVTQRLATSNVISSGTQSSNS